MKQFTMEFYVKITTGCVKSMEKYYYNLETFSIKSIQNYTDMYLRFETVVEEADGNGMAFTKQTLCYWTDGPKFYQVGGETTTATYN